MSVTGPYYSYSQLEQLWIQNGGNAALAPIAAAIALAESGGGAGALNPTDNSGKQTSWGLWQISNGTHSMPVPNILDPNVNAGAAVAKYNGAHGWSPWGTYSSGAYKRYLQNGVAPSSAGVPAGGSGPGAGLGGPVINGSGGTPTATDISNISTVGSPCLVGWDGLSVLGGAGNFCLITKVEMRNTLGVLLLGAGGLLGLVAIVLLVKGEFAAPKVPNINITVPPTARSAPEPTPEKEVDTPRPTPVTATRVTPGRPAPGPRTMLTRPVTLGLPRGST